MFFCQEKKRFHSKTFNILCSFVFAHETNGWAREQPNSGLRGSFTADHLPYILGCKKKIFFSQQSNFQKYLRLSIGRGLGEKWRGGVGESGTTNLMLAFQKQNFQFSAEDKQLCRVMITYVANFVKSGLKKLKFSGPNPYINFDIS